VIEHHGRPEGSPPASGEIEALAVVGR